MKLSFRLGIENDLQEIPNGKKANKKDKELEKEKIYVSKPQ